MAIADAVLARVNRSSSWVQGTGNGSWGLAEDIGGAVKSGVSSVGTCRTDGGSMTVVTCAGNGPRGIGSGMAGRLVEADSGGRHRVD